jgi:phenylpyruvate tautomerase
MPLARLTVSVEVPNDQREILLAAVSAIVVKATGKPEAYMMVTLGECEIFMGGKRAPAAYLDVRGIGGLTPGVNARIAREVGDLLEKELRIALGNVYITFTDVAAANWGWNGGTFG